MSHGMLVVSMLVAMLEFPSYKGNVVIRPSANSYL